MTKITIRDVAAQAGVSISVASNALNNKGRVSGETRERVLQSAREIGYVPSYTAQRLRGQGHAIGVLMMAPPSELVSARYFSESLYGLIQATNTIHYKLHYLHIQEPLTEALLQRRLRDGAVDGIVVMVPDPQEVEVLMQGLQALPHIFFGAAPERADVSFVDSDGETGAQIATRHFLALGHTRIGYLLPGDSNLNAEDRRRGYLKTMQMAGLPTFVYKPDVWNGPLPMEQILADGITAMVAFDDFHAARLIGELHRLGRRVPQDMGVIGFDDEMFGEWMYPTLTTLHQPLTEMATQAAMYLMNALESEEAVAPCRKVYPVELVVRESCGAALRQVKP